MAGKSAAGSGSIRKKTITRNGKTYTYWEARYTAGYDKGTGKQIQKSISGKTQKEVAKKLKEVTHQLDAGAYIAPSKMTVGLWLDIWTRDYLGGVKPSTAAVYAATIENHIKPALGAVPLKELAAHDIQGFYNHLTDSGLSPKTVKNVHGVLHEALQQAQQGKEIPFNPADAVKLPRVEKKELRPLDEQESAAFLRVIQGQRYEVPFTVTLFTGMRIGEIVGLTWDRVDFERGLITIDRQLQAKGTHGEYVFTSTKSGKGRTIAPASWGMRLLREHWKRQIALRLKAGPLWDDTGYVFSNDVGGHLAFRTIDKDFKKAVAAIGRPDARFHDLRHSYAVAAIRSGDDIKTVQGNLGHATAAFTLDVYGHVTEQMKQDSAARMDSYISDVLRQKQG